MARLAWLTLGLVAGLIATGGALPPLTMYRTPAGGRSRRAGTA